AEPRLPRRRSLIQQGSAAGVALRWYGNRQVPLCAGLALLSGPGQGEPGNSVYVVVRGVAHDGDPHSLGGVNADQVEESGAAAEVLHERWVGIALAGRAEPPQAEVIPLSGHGDMPHGGGGLRGQDTGPVKLAIAQMHLQEAGCVPDGPEQAAVG